MPHYDDPALLLAVEEQLAAAAPVVTPAGCARLREEMAKVAKGEAYLLQGGDCAESFNDAVADRVARLSGLFDAMDGVLSDGLGLPILHVARIGGQFAKPRSAATEARGPVELPAYRGDIINGIGFSGEERRADPQRMLRAHLQSVGTVATLKAARGGRDPVYTSHEGLLLPYEEALTRQDEDGRWWATSGHMLWLGYRTNDLDGAHVDYLSGIENVVGVKVGPGMDADQVLALAERLDPRNRAGKLLLIARFGAKRIEAELPALMQATQAAGLNAAWSVDPMHGNTETIEGRKVRRVDAIERDIAAFFAIARAQGVHASGVHLEMSPDDVTECLGGSGPTDPSDLDRAYRTACDPRLNPGQATALASFIAGLA
ncbi:3-deoxy-7-phosphoheptulonate synthase [Sphingomicrobium sp. B8]|uniref:Phospho-2-dehydro-3-deoxyheptonate aldolase n=2 Tax=Sphingomicrobium clamense TaxID=2851013 RepID=A0ABS6V2L4_9SPHN|nr:3-deoxy-7-phosphoheptulonate synthase [Sphingomicrobium sp. B8]